MAGLCAPLPTLRRRPYGLRRTARGRYGSLLLHRIGLAPTARCRSPGALRKILDTTLTDVRGRGTRRIASESFLPRREKLSTAVIEVLEKKTRMRRERSR